MPTQEIPPMPRPNADLGKIPVIARIPGKFHAEEDDRLPAGLVGASILRFGTVPREVAEASSPRLEGGGLVIDYVPEGSTSPRRVAMSFSERGMRVAYQGDLAEACIYL
jgi:hypothetical protein